MKNVLNNLWKKFSQESSSENKTTNENSVSEKKEWNYLLQLTSL